MELALITGNQIVILFVLIFTGFLTYKMGLITLEGKKSISNLLLYIVSPSLILNTYQVDFNTEMFHGLLNALLLSFLVHIISFAVAFIFIRPQKNSDFAIERFAVIFSNAGYMGIPLIQALYGTEGTFYSTAYLTAFNIVMWTLGVIMMTGKTDIKTILNAFKSPSVIAVFIGISVYLLKIKLPSVIGQPISYIASMNTPVAMLLTGISIAGSPLGKMLRRKELYIISSLKLLLIPAVCLAVFCLLGVSSLSSLVILITSACPSAAATTMFAIKYEKNEEIGAGSVIISTLLCIVTLPLFVFITGFFF